MELNVEFSDFNCDLMIRGRDPETGLRAGVRVKRPEYDVAADGALELKYTKAVWSRGEDDLHDTAGVRYFAPPDEYAPHIADHFQSDEIAAFTIPDDTRANHPALSEMMDKLIADARDGKIPAPTRAGGEPLAQRLQRIAAHPPI